MIDLFDVLLVAETLAVFFTARHFGAPFAAACWCTVIVNGLIAIGFTVATIRNLRTLERERWRQ